MSSNHSNHGNHSNHSSHSNHFNLKSAAHATMLEHGFQPDFSAEADAELQSIEHQSALPDAPSAIKRSIVTYLPADTPGPIFVAPN